jgi:hypothetical protein
MKRMGSGLRGVTSGRIDCTAQPWALQMMCAAQIQHWVTVRLTIWSVAQ